MAVSSPAKYGVGRKPTTWVQLSRGASTLSPSPQVEKIRCEKSSGSPGLDRQRDRVLGRVLDREGARLERLEGLLAELHAGAGDVQHRCDVSPAPSPYGVAFQLLAGPRCGPPPGGRSGGARGTGRPGPRSTRPRGCSSGVAQASSDDVSGQVDSGWPGLKSSGTKPGSTATTTGLLADVLDPDRPLREAVPRLLAELRRGADRHRASCLPLPSTASRMQRSPRRRRKASRSSLPLPWVR